MSRHTPFSIGRLIRLVGPLALLAALVAPSALAYGPDKDKQGDDPEVKVGRENAAQNDKEVKLINDPAILERVNRIGQEMGSKIYRVDVVNSSDAAHFISWKREGWLAPYVSEEMARDLPAEMLDADGLFCNQRTHLSTIAYNTKLLSPADAPKGFKDLLDPKYAGKMVKGHPGYSGTIMTATHQIARELGWSYFEKLAKQKVLQVQSATEPPKRLEAGERAVAVDGSDYLFWLAKERGQPIEVVLAVEGTPQISNPMGIFKSAPNPNAARLMASWIMSAEGQSFIVNLSGQYPANKQVKPKPGRPVLSQIKTFKEDPAEVEKQADQIKAQYAKYFKV